MKFVPTLVPSSLATACALLALASAPAAAAGELLVRVSGIASAAGEIGCSLFPAGAGFPMDHRTARQVWTPADTQGVSCRFADVGEGRWAVAVSHDLNGNRKVDTNLFGLPTEAWGVSNNARPALRAPRFDEAAFKVTADQPVALDIKVAK